MGKSLKDRMKKLPPQRRARIEARAEELIQEELTLRDVRKKMNLTQEELADLLDKGQDTISRLERQPDARISTLMEVLRALGGTLRLVAEFPGRPPLTLTGFGDQATKKKAGIRKRPGRKKGGSGENRPSA
jgi:DNA-binding XRE family transcriptional regulator